LKENLLQLLLKFKQGSRKDIRILEKIGGGSNEKEPIKEQMLRGLVRKLLREHSFEGLNEADEEVANSVEKN
jgi:hypothetical protein